MFECLRLRQISACSVGCTGFRVLSLSLGLGLRVSSKTDKRFQAVGPQKLPPTDRPWTMA